METNAIYCGDCLDVLKRFPDNSIDLIYLDPPFFSNKHYEIIWKDGAEIRAFGDRWKGGINHYVGWMRERLEQCHRALKETGLIYLHCDWHAGHYLKIIMDKIFGEKNFRNEIVWCYAGGGIPTKDFPRKHDTIFRYSKGDKYTFNAEYRPYSEGTLKVGGGRHSLTSGGKAVDVKRGTPINDWWDDMPKLTSYQKQWQGYPTQKPENLLERIIKTSSNKGDIVLDPFCGCGTTLVAAHKLERKWIGIDVSPTACKLMDRRLRSLGANPKLIVGNLSVSDLKKYPPFEFQNWVCEKLGGRINKRKSGDMGIDGWTLDMTPIQVKQSEDVSRNPIDNFQTAIRRVNKKSGIFVAFSFGKGAYEEAARAKLSDGIEIKMITAKELLESK